MLEIIRNRRSHFLKEFNGKKADKLLINGLLETTVWAPSHRLTLPFRFHVFGPEKITQLAQLIEESYTINNTSVDPLKIEKFRSYPIKLSHAIAIVFKPTGKVPEWEEFASLGAAVQNMYLQLSTQNAFGGYWTTGNESNSDILRRHMGLLDSEVHCGCFFIGGINTQRTEANRPPADVAWDQ